MILEKFRTWAQTASPATRAEGASALARAYLHARSNERQRHDAAAVLTSFLDDPSPLVRTALARAFASARGAPHHIILALADDLPPIAAIVLAASPILNDAELIDCAMTAEGTAQSAIAARPNLAAPVVATLAEIGSIEVLIALVGNRTAALSEATIRGMFARFVDNAELREALLARPGVPTLIRVDLVAATMRALLSQVAERKWMSDERLKRLGRQAKDRAVIVVAEANRGWTGALELATHLRESGDLTLSLVFRTILSGKIELFKAALSVLADVPVIRVDELVDRYDAGAFAGLYRKAGLPPELLPAIRIALDAARETDWSVARGAGLSCLVIQRVLTECDAINTGDLDTLLVLLRRFESEAARDATRAAPPRRHEGEPSAAPARAIRCRAALAGRSRRRDRAAPSGPATSRARALYNRHGRHRGRALRGIGSDYGRTLGSMTGSATPRSHRRAASAKEPASTTRTKQSICSSATAESTEGISELTAAWLEHQPGTSGGRRPKPSKLLGQPDIEPAPRPVLRREHADAAAVAELVDRVEGVDDVEAHAQRFRVAAEFELLNQPEVDLRVRRHVVQVGEAGALAAGVHHISRHKCPAKLVGRAGRRGDQLHVVGENVVFRDVGILACIENVLVRHGLRVLHPSGGKIAVGREAARLVACPRLEPLALGPGEV